MYPLYFFIAALICYGFLICIMIYAIGIYKRARELNPLNKKLNQLEADIRVASATKEQINADIEALRDQVGYYQKVITDGQAAEEYLEKVGGNVESAMAYISKLKEDTKEATEKLEEARKKLDDVNEFVYKAQQLEQELKVKADSHQRLYDELKGKIETLENNVDILKTENNNLSAEKAKLQSEANDLRRQIEDLKGELDRIRAEVKKGQDLVDNSRNQLAVVKKNLAEDEAKLTGLQTQIGNIKGVDAWHELDTGVISDAKFTSPNFSGKNEIREIDELNKFAANLDSCNIKFDKRTINAFHTSLKVASSSPLVVLAGISGTGKSLLPQLYAKHFGFNFLNMAVQPRWDSSQDLFGFYNYAQFSYKATELSRLLWQYDVYNNEKCAFKGCSNLRPMNIVLLDEMNLARVEYYFSDMLSKLETRRTINADNKAERAMAEIELECGSSILPRRLFVDKNTLFVGTMNEDETTQALSDKIMDRANVLRFGRPKSLQSQGDPIEFGKKYANVDPITIKEWDSIFKKSTSLNDISKLDKKIDELNEIMERLGRPFAHRVKKAIVDYVSNYPNVDNPKEFNNALSDQIEFKIMPKLNGLDKSNPDVNDELNGLNNLVEKIDPELSLTFDKVIQDNSSSFFTWTGVGR